MNFESYINQAWNSHAEQPEKVAGEFPVGARLAQSNEELVQLAGLVSHIMGEHLGEWEQGKSFLEELRHHPAFHQDTEADFALRRSLAVMQLGQGNHSPLKKLSPSDQARVLAVAASALIERDTDRSGEFLRTALKLARENLHRDDPASRALAVTGNNIACSLEEKPLRTDADTELMILAAEAGREFWELAGTWLEVSRAEYRLSMSYLKSGDLDKALRHAEICLKMCQEHGADDVDMFFALEAVAKVEKARNNQTGFEKNLTLASQRFENLSAGDRDWCRPSLEKLSSGA